METEITMPFWRFLVCTLVPVLVVNAAWWLGTWAEHKQRKELVDAIKARGRTIQIWTREEG